MTAAEVIDLLKILAACVAGGATIVLGLWKILSAHRASIDAQLAGHRTAIDDKLDSMDLSRRAGEEAARVRDGMAQQDLHKVELRIAESYASRADLQSATAAISREVAAGFERLDEKMTLLTDGLEARIGLTLSSVPAETADPASPGRRRARSRAATG